MIKKFVIVSLLYVFWSFSTLLFAQSGTTFHQVFNTDNNTQKVLLNIKIPEENIEIRRTAGSRIMVETSVKISMVNDNLLNYLGNSGRYDLSSAYNEAESTITLSEPKDNNVIIVKGQECVETITYTITIPESIPVVGFCGEGQSTAAVIQN